MNSSRNVSGNITEIIIDGLQPFTEYGFSVVAVTVEPGAPSETVNATTSEAGILALLTVPKMVYDSQRG